MRIALLTKRYPPECCGVGDYVAQLARAIAAHGDEPIVFTVAGQTSGPHSARVVTIPLHGWRGLRSLLQRFASERVERVQIEYSGYGWGRWGFAFWVNALVAALRWRGLPVTLALHEFPLRLVQHPLQAPVIAVQWAHILLLAATASDVVTNTQPRVCTLHFLLPWRRARIRYRPNSSTIPVTAISADQRAALRTRCGATAETVVVATFGMFGAGKNYEALIAAAAEVRKHVPLKLWLLGNWQAARPEYIEELRALARRAEMQADVFWSGALPPEEISAHLQAADLFVLPQPDGHLTRSSAFLAAAAHGLPCIAVRNASHQAEFTHALQVWLVNRSEPSTLAAAIEEFAAHPELRRALGRNLRALYEEAFDWRVTASRAPAGAPASRARIATGSAVPPVPAGQTKDA